MHITHETAVSLNPHNSRQLGYKQTCQNVVSTKKLHLVDSSVKI